MKVTLQKYKKKEEEENETLRKEERKQFFKYVIRIDVILPSFVDMCVHVDEKRQPILTVVL